MAAPPAQQVIATLHEAGLTLALTPDLGLKVAPASSLTPQLRDLIRASKGTLISWLQRDPANDPPPAPPAPEGEREAFEERVAVMEFDGGRSPAEAEGRTIPAPLNEVEIDTFTARLGRLMDLGVILEAAEALADKLLIRDREGDDRRVCLECSYYGSSGRCVAAATGRLPGVSARLEPVPTILQRCEAFGLRPSFDYGHMNRFEMEK